MSSIRLKEETLLVSISTVGLSSLLDDTYRPTGVIKHKRRRSFVLNFILRGSCTPQRTKATAPFFPRDVNCLRPCVATSVPFERCTVCLQRGRRGLTLCILHGKGFLFMRCIFTLGYLQRAQLITNDSLGTFCIMLHQLPSDRGISDVTYHVKRYDSIDNRQFRRLYRAIICNFEGLLGHSAR